MVLQFLVLVAVNPGLNGRGISGHGKSEEFIRDQMNLINSKPTFNTAIKEFFSFYHFLSSWIILS